MKFATPPCLLLGLSLCALAQEPPKTNSSLPVDTGLLLEEPYRHTGLVFATGGTRGSGFVASDPKLFFTAAHVLRFSPSAGGDASNDRWSMPPSWVGGSFSSGTIPEFTAAVPSRGYFRWGSYTTHVSESGKNSRPAFNRDIALAWGLEDFTDGEPAEIDFKGRVNLSKRFPSMITGYPATLDYTGESGGYYMHATELDLTPFKSFSPSGNYLYATHISTGPGNSGGPVWSKGPSGEWKVAGVLVSGRPSEAGIYAMSPAVKSLLKAAAPVIGSPRKSSKAAKAVTTSTARMVLKKPKKIPDGVHRWTKIPLKCLKFPDDSSVISAKLDLTITSGHRGDLIVRVVGPDGAFATVHDGQGAGTDDLVFDDLDISASFVGGESGPLSANGNWQLLVQDRLTGDPSVVTRLELEIIAEESGSAGGR